MAGTYPLRALRAALRLTPVAALAASLLALASPAAAQTRRIDTAFNVQPLSFVALAGGGEGVGNVRTIRDGEVVMRTRVGYSAVAAPHRDVPLTLADVPMTIRQGARLFEATPMSDTRRSLGEGTLIFCDDAQQARGAQPPARGRGLGRRFQNEIRPCLLDRDGDGRFDAAILIGARWPQDWRIIQIPPVTYDVATGIPIPNSELEVRFGGAALLSGATLHLGGRVSGIRLIGGAVRMQTMDAERRVDGTQGVAEDSYPHMIRFGAARIAILAYDREAREVRLRVDHGFERARLLFEFFIRDNTIVILSGG